MTATDVPRSTTQRTTSSSSSNAHASSGGTPAVAVIRLVLLAETVDGLEAVRMAASSRLRALRDDYGVAGTREYQRVETLVANTAALEHQAIVELQRGMREHPLGPFVRATPGLGQKQVARLLAAIGDPAVRYVVDDADQIRSIPRTLPQLWAYCGLHVVPAAGHSSGSPRAQTTVASGGDVAPARRRGEPANWSGDARLRAFLVASSCVKHRPSPYRPVYDRGRAKYAGATHPAPCPRCGPAGRPALAGSPLNLGHQHARAVRLVAKAVLRDLWRESRRVHALAGGRSVDGSI